MIYQVTRVKKNVAPYLPWRDILLILYEITYLVAHIRQCCFSGGVADVLLHRCHWDIFCNDTGKIGCFLTTRKHKMRTMYTISVCIHYVYLPRFTGIRDMEVCLSHLHYQWQYSHDLQQYGSTGTQLCHDKFSYASLKQHYRQHFDIDIEQSKHKMFDLCKNKSNQTAYKEKQYTEAYKIWIMFPYAVVFRWWNWYIWLFTSRHQILDNDR